MFGAESQFEKYLGCKVAAFAAEGYRPRDELAYVMYTQVGQQVGRFAMRDDRTMFLFIFRDDDVAGSDGPQAQKALLRKRFGNRGWECPHILDALDATDDLYFDRVSQIRMNPQQGLWTRGRVTLIGDAAPASRCSPGKVPHWPWWRRTSLQANYTAQMATIPQRLGGTRSCSGHSFSPSKRPHCVLQVHLPRNRNLVCFCAIESSILWQSPGLPILLLAAISLTKSSCRITNKRCLGRGDSRDCLEFLKEEQVMSDNPKQAASSAAIRSSGPLESPILSFDLNTEIEQLRSENAWQGGRNSKTLVKYPDFRVVLTVLKSNARLHERKAAGRISVQAIAGDIRMHVQDKVINLPAGHMLALERALPHDVEALEDSAFLLTIAWPEEAKP